MARRRRRERELAEEVKGDMTPMIDVIFQLLIFFMLAMDIKQLEGKILSYLPKDKGLAAAAVENPELREIRVKVKSKGDGTGIADILIEERPIGTVSIDIDRDSNSLGEEGSENAAVWASLQEQIRTWFNKMKASNPDAYMKVPCIIDPVDSKAPFQFMVRVLDQARKVGVEKIEFTGSAEFHEFERAASRGR